MAHRGYRKNEYGTQISVHQCDTCGVEFTVCPAKFPEDKGWEGCLAPECGSYDPSRDLGKETDEGPIDVIPSQPIGKA